MAYSSHLINSLAEVVSLWGDFAESTGWLVNRTNPLRPVVTHPTIPGALPMRMWYQDAGTFAKYLNIDSADPAVTSFATTNAPVLNPNALPNGARVSTPTKVHFIGRSSGNPFIATIIEFGYNSYRHLYFGYMEKSSNYTGGEIISGVRSMVSGYATAGTSVFLGWDHSRQTDMYYLFTGGYSASLTATGRGGVRVVHPNNPKPWRRFASSSFSPTSISDFAGSDREGTAIGGYTDGVGTGYAIAGKSEYALSAVVAPISIMITTAIANQTFFRHIGRPAGIRNINIENFDPGAQVNPGSRSFMVFPVMRKSSANGISIANPSTGTDANTKFPIAETSCFLGYAYELD